MWVCCWPSKERGQGRPVVGDAGLQLDRWANFYVITSTAAVTLVGLLFVVITLAAGRASVSDAGKIRVYLTPTVVYLASVLYFAAVLTFPTQSRLSAGVCCCLGGAAGIVYPISMLFGSSGAGRFYEREDLFYYVASPSAAYALIIVGDTSSPFGAAREALDLFDQHGRGQVEWLEALLRAAERDGALACGDERGGEALCVGRVQTTLAEQRGKPRAPFTKNPSGALAKLRCVRRHRDREDRAPGLEIRARENAAPHLQEDRGDLARRRACASLDEGERAFARQCDRRGDELGFAAGKVMVERPPGRAGVLDHLGERRPLEPARGEHRHRALDHAGLRVGGHRALTMTMIMEYGSV